DDVSGLLVPGHEPARWADALAEVALRPEVRRRLSAGAVEHARRFSWERTTDELLAGYVAAAGAFSDALGGVAV
ncbi:MAG TPA: D-inositol-3-phosphate glycosyltransferase, partial [Pseudonocardiaceae bacterium]